MSKNIKSTRSVSHPYLWRWVKQFGRVEIGYCHQTRSFIRLMEKAAWSGTVAGPTRHSTRLWRMPMPGQHAG
jgi:hypothetical protein